MNNTALSFIPTDDETLSLVFGHTSISLHREGKITFAVGNTQCTLLPDKICLHTDKAKIEISDEKISIEGETILQHSHKNMIFKTQKAFAFELE
jgi:hypothetical protein